MKRQVTDDYCYFMNHWDHIEGKRVPDAPGCSAEGHVSHLLSARLSSRPMGWSITNLEQMAANGIPIVYEKYVENNLSNLHVLPNKVLSAAKIKMYSKVAAGTNNVVPPILATGNRTSTYIALRGLADGNAVI